MAEIVVCTQVYKYSFISLPVGAVPPCTQLWKVLLAFKLWSFVWPSSVFTVVPDCLSKFVRACENRQQSDKVEGEGSQQRLLRPDQTH